MFTRHLYETEEVLAALSWCISKGRTKEAVFWSLELLDSGLKDMLQTELLSTWLWHFGIGRLSAMPLLSGDSDEELLHVVCGLSRLPTRDRSVVTLLILGLDTEQPDRASFFPCLETLFQETSCSELEQAFLAATYQGKSRLAFALSRSLWQTNPARVFSLLQRLQSLKQANLELAECLTLLELAPTELTWPSRACAIAAICLDSKRLAHSLKPLNLNPLVEVETSLKDWNDLTGRKARRVFPIPIECLYGRTARGRLSNKETTLSTLYTLSSDTLEGCPAWNTILEEEVPWLDDERKEAFYDLYFPDDIPDEWSRKDQEKSHGFGCLINQEIPSLKKYIDRWFLRHPTRAYWISTRALLDKVPSGFPSWSELYTKNWIDCVSTWCLTPVKKRSLVVENQTSV